MNIDDYKAKFSDDSSPGWDAISVPLVEIYGEQEPFHWGTLLSHSLGGPDPLDGVSAYRSDQGGVDHLHFVTFGYSSLYYDEESVGQDFSKFGFEMTLRLAPTAAQEDCTWVVGFLQNIARYVFQSGKHFAQHHFLPANGPIRADSDTEIVGLAFDYDTVLPNSISTEHGNVEFIQGFGLIQSEIDEILSKEKTVEALLAEHRENNPYLITDLHRTAG